MTSDSTAEVRAQLNATLAELERRLASIKRDVTRSHSGDWAEQAQERENDEVEDAIGVETRQSIADTRAALARLDAGTYGSCERCGEPISAARLQVLPTAAHCVNCAD
ncbi:MAG: dimethylmenaquinone methyltransferase [Haliea sp.]|uniref:TraR/DksA family transcriptional regulator n=1 Tax=Haliea sp. TaxID=1932666 RepID=UPI000C50C36E|nr:TraR/DksA family transcriptional regulator [Haliea sp.]MBM69664.1 dimethylmenaquinone methyltransferase [Haliea sp.]|tara:strand:- start:419 stop:742 length:324 start_codon:yes stop_codon:yes gene_type:complete